MERLPLCPVQNILIRKTYLTLTGFKRPTPKLPLLHWQVHFAPQRSTLNSVHSLKNHPNNQLSPSTSSSSRTGPHTKPRWNYLVLERCFDFSLALSNGPSSLSCSRRLSLDDKIGSSGHYEYRSRSIQQHQLRRHQGLQLFVIREWRQLSIYVQLLQDQRAGLRCRNELLSNDRPRRELFYLSRWWRTRWVLLSCR